MTTEEFGRIVKALRTYYPDRQTTPNEQAFLLWYEQFQDDNVEDVAAALKRWAATEKWPPTIAELKHYTHNSQYAVALEQRRVEGITAAAQALLESKEKEAEDGKEGRGRALQGQRENQN